MVIFAVSLSVTAMEFQMETPMVFRKVAAMENPFSFDAAKHSTELDLGLALAFLSDSLLVKIFSFGAATKPATRLFLFWARRLVMELLSESASALVISFLRW